MSRPAPMAPKFAPSATTTTATPAESASSDAAPALAERLAKLAPEQLAAIEAHLDELEAGTPAKAPLEVLATRWWFPPDGSTTPVVLQRVRGLAFTVLQVPEDCRVAQTLHRFGPPLAGVLRGDQAAPGRWFDDAAPVRTVGTPGRSFPHNPLPTTPWDGYAPRFRSKH